MENKEQTATPEEVAKALGEQVMRLRQELVRATQVNQELQKMLSYRRLDYLFKVVENANKFSAEFITICVEEIENSLTPIEEEKSEE